VFIISTTTRSKPEEEEEGRKLWLITLIVSSIKFTFQFIGAREREGRNENLNIA